MSTGSVFTERDLQARYAPKGERWESEAICSTADPSLFEVNEDDPKGSSSLIESGIDIYCQFCPVSNECLSSSTEEDRLWTTRGGQKPTSLKGLLAGEEVVMEGEGTPLFVAHPIEKRMDEYTCKRNHPKSRYVIRDRVNRKGNKFKAIICQECRLINERKRNEKAP